MYSIRSCGFFVEPNPLHGDRATSSAIQRVCCIYFTICYFWYVFCFMWLNKPSQWSICSICCYWSVSKFIGIDEREWSIHELESSCLNTHLRVIQLSDEKRYLIVFLRIYWILYYRILLFKVLERHTTSIRLNEKNANISNKLQQFRNQLEHYQFFDGNGSTLR